MLGFGLGPQKRTKSEERVPDSRLPQANSHIQGLYARVRIEVFPSTLNVSDEHPREQLLSRKNT